MATLFPLPLEVRDETWTYDFDSNTWTNMNPSVRPPSRFEHVMAYDAGSDRVILFGGFLPGGAETWAYDVDSNTWTNMSPSLQPPAWTSGDVAYDAESDRIVLFGGVAAATLFPLPLEVRDETWTYDFDSNTWTNMTPSTAPTRRFGHRMAYDSESDRIVLFGGFITPVSAGGDTWTYDLNTNTWAKMNPQEAPSQRGFHGMAYDSNSDRVLLFGAFPVVGDTWLYDLNEDTWTRTESAMGPPGRGAGGLVYDGGSDRVVLFGGDDGDATYDDTWSHRLVFPPPPIPEWVYIVVGVVAAAAVVAAIVILRRRGKAGGGEQE